MTGTVREDPPHRPAGIVTRGLAAVIDIGIVLTMLVGVYLALMFARLLFSPQDFRFPEVRAILSVTTFLALSVLYLTAFWATSGRTVGAVVMGLRMVSRNGRLVRWPRCAARAVLCVLFGFGLLWVAIDPRRRSLQDIVLRTSVVYDWRADPTIVEHRALRD
ncbi:RDD family protein [Rhodococcus sp. AG1013]|uniref:RDD family protein n=1 Tax=unclassified Rhodococcus (in: high G+C Gram-positive bacteria) TaxID=192944 RepID=UPI000E0C8750|nr:RDD family protein [Rhodococcus sp. AG1013]RDI26944.1 putative RDD family membrane protein YckC [Rhodococcus sp. AG1013]